MTEQDEKQRLIEQMRSRDNAEALKAVAMLREDGWLTDGTLRGADLSGANLEGANLFHGYLYNVNLTGANLREANMSGGYLYHANLTSATLSNAYLHRANLSAAELHLAILSHAYLAGANLRDAYLTGANLSRADFSSADLSRSRLIGVDLGPAKEAGLVGGPGADLTEANLIGANLGGANLLRARLAGANFSGVVCYGTSFADVDLSEVIGLDTVQHLGPSSVGTDTLRISRNVPESFLRGCGLPDVFVEYLPWLSKQPIQFYSCFISYSHADEEFAGLLHDRLWKMGINCWKDEHQINPGDKLVREIDRGIRIWDKVLLCCSETSLHSWWVDKEITMALGKEEELTKARGEEVLVLIPLDLDGYLFGGYRGEYEKVLTGRDVPRFQGWKQDHDLFEAQLARVVRALTVGGGKLPPPEPKL